jgi:Tol biopolymer transport system component
LALTPGTRLGVYEVTAQIGEGGMGQVYRATDTKLKRQVAVKILPPSLSTDPDRLARFQREAEVLASLNHPHIAAIYGIEESDEVRALVMELVEGDDLSQRIARGAIPLDEALPIAKQIAEALEAAHEQGIIHRDLKPANIKVRPDGTVKVLDFGLAKAAAGAAGTGSRPLDLANSPTMTSPAMTRQGIILGTAAYMSPEQARGKDTDKRADIWAFGVVLYEMLSGRQLFEGETLSDTLAALLTRVPDMDALPATVPTHVRSLIARCLERDPKRRLRDIGEARIALDAPGSATALPVPAAVAVAAPARSRLIPFAIGAAVLMASAAFAGWWIGRRPVPTEALWQQFTQLTDQAGEEIEPVISPDGASIAYASRARGSWDIYLQRIGGRNPVMVAGDPRRNERAPAFSPDGTTIAFHEGDADGGIFVVGATGESARRLTDAGFHPAWSPDGKQIAYCSEEINDPHSRGTTSALWIVGADGGTPRKIHDGDAVQPAWSPSGQRLAFWAAIGGQRDIFTIPVSGGTPVPLFTDAPLDWSPMWAPDGRSLYFASDRGGTMNIWRVAIDQSSGRAMGAAEPVTNGVQAAAEQPSVSRDGARLVFRARLAAVNPVRMAFDPATERLGDPQPLFHRTGLLVPSSVSPDGQWLALANLGERQEDLFVSRTDGSELRRLTDDLARDRIPRWSPDGKEIAFYSNRGGKYAVWSVKPDGGGLRQISEWPDGELMFPTYSAAGDRMVVNDNNGKTSFIINPYLPWKSQQLKALVRTPGDSDFFVVAWSPDGHRLVGSPMIGFGVIVHDLETGRTSRVGDDPNTTSSQWLPDGRRVIIVNDDGQLAILDVDSGRRRVLTVPFRVSSDGLALPRDGRTIYLGRADIESDVWMVEPRR